jgi:protein CpxP
MRPWLKRGLIGIFGLSMLTGGLAACSHQRHYGYFGDRTSEAERAEKRTRMVEKAARKLDLDATQKAKLTVLADTLETQRQAMKASGGEPHAELKAVLAGPQFDRAKAQSLADAKTGALRTATPAVVNAAADFFDSLKPEQQQKLREALDSWGHHRGHRGWLG